MLEVCDVSKGFSGHPVLSAVSFAIETAQIFGLLGNNGTGKTTLLRLIAGLESPQAGTIRWRGELWTSKDYVRPPWERAIGMMFQHPTLWPHLSVRQHLEFTLQSTALSQDARQERIGQWLAALDLHSLQARFPAELSGGQQSRVALARALVREPDLLLLDESFASMDAAYQAQAWGLVRDFVTKRRAAALLVTHDQSWAEAHLDKLFVLAKG